MVLTIRARCVSNECPASSARSTFLIVCSIKGIVIDAWAKINVTGITLLIVEARVVVASIETYVQFASL